jgi:hypothetical protein
VTFVKKPLARWQREAEANQRYWAKRFQKHGGLKPTALGCHTPKLVVLRLLRVEISCCL